MSHRKRQSTTVSIYHQAEKIYTVSKATRYGIMMKVYSNRRMTTMFHPYFRRDSGWMRVAGNGYVSLCTMPVVADSDMNRELNTSYRFCL
jgi:hypothetical protein